MIAQTMIDSILQALDFEKDCLDHKRLFPDRMGPDMRKALEDRYIDINNTRFDLKGLFPVMVRNFDLQNGRYPDTTAAGEIK